MVGCDLKLFESEVSEVAQAHKSLFLNVCSKDNVTFYIDCIVIYNVDLRNGVMMILTTDVQNGLALLLLSVPEDSK